MRSIWEETAMSAFPSLSERINTDVLIIGGGLCGLLCAYLLHQAGIDYALVEADTLCSGITKHTTAKITVQHGLIYRRLMDTYGLEKAKQYLLANEAALERYSVLGKEIDCDFERGDSFVYSLDDFKALEREYDALKALGQRTTLCKSLSLPFSVAGAIKMENQAQFHPLKFAAAICKGLNIYEHTKVRELIGMKAVTGGAAIHAKRVLMTTHFPMINKHGLYALKLYQHRSYVLALEHAPRAEGMLVDEAKEGMSFRNCENLLLLGGGGHRTGKSGGGWRELRDFVKRHYPQAEERFHWATQDCMSLDGVPYVGPYSAGTEGLYVATGFNKWGMTTAMAAAMLLSDQMQGKENPYSAVFSPSRSILHPQLAVNAGEAMLSLLTPKKRRCPHLGCALKWNPHERTWDCPCHGSRFSADGKLIDNPATGDLKA